MVLANFTSIQHFRYAKSLAYNTFVRSQASELLHKGPQTSHFMPQKDVAKY